MYIIKKHYEATAKNTNFAGDVLDWYYGKKGTLLSGGFGELPSQGEIDSFGYTGRAGAKRALRAAQELAASETAHGSWNVTVELLEV